MGEEERPERRSMVGAPPTARKPTASFSRPASELQIAQQITCLTGSLSGTPRASALRGSAKKKQEEESEEERESGSEKQDSDAGDGEEDSTAEETAENGTPGKPKRKRRRVHLTDYSARKKQREKEREKLRKAGFLEEPSKTAPEEPEEKKPTPPPPTPEPVFSASTNGGSSVTQDHVKGSRRVLRISGHTIDGAGLS
ncbi:unnamed protein product [Nippostrongylus brasiliensis]|uniref:Hepatoma-derived growth factor-related protein 2 n=1 Tax=Nippostrongylus brasiliensis TaxID=27835 RepID=A0A0N4XFV0_NIPBR|nr:unnamed protein product [Nippostrongylus brasiliensis]